MSINPFLLNVIDCVSMREGKEHVEGPNSKVKLQLYKSFGKEVDFKTYLRGVSDAGTRLPFKFRSGTHSLNDELGRHRGRNGRTECILCGDECESVVHILWECPVYKDKRDGFMVILRDILEEAFKDFEALENIKKLLLCLVVSFGQKISMLCLL